MSNGTNTTVGGAIGGMGGAVGASMLAGMNPMEIVRRGGGYPATFITSIVPAFTEALEVSNRLSLTLQDLKLRSEQFDGSVFSLTNQVHRWANSLSMSRKEMAQLMTTIDQSNRYGLDLKETLDSVVDTLDRMDVAPGAAREQMARRLIQLQQEFGMFPDLLKKATEAFEKGKGEITTTDLGGIDLIRQRAVMTGDLKQLKDYRELIATSRKAGLGEGYEGVESLGARGIARLVTERVSQGTGEFLQSQGKYGAITSPLATGAATAILIPHIMKVFRGMMTYAGVLDRTGSSSPVTRRTTTMDEDIGTPVGRTIPSELGTMTNPMWVRMVGSGGTGLTGVHSSTRVIGMQGDDVVPHDIESAIPTSVPRQGILTKIKKHIGGKSEDFLDPRISLKDKVFSVGSSGLMGMAAGSVISGITQSVVSHISDKREKEESGSGMKKSDQLLVSGGIGLLTSLGTGAATGGIPGMIAAGIGSAIGGIIAVVSARREEAKKQADTTEGAYLRSLDTQIKMVGELEQTKAHIQMVADTTAKQLSYLSSMSTYAETSGQSIDSVIGIAEQSAKILERSAAEQRYHLQERQKELEGKELTREERVEFDVLIKDLERTQIELETQKLKAQLLPSQLVSQQAQLVGGRAGALAGHMQSMGFMGRDITPIQRMQIASIEGSISGKSYELDILRKTSGDKFDPNSPAAQKLKQEIETLSYQKEQLLYQTEILAKYQDGVKLLDAQKNLYSSMQSIAQTLQLPWSMQVKYAKQMVDVSEQQLNLQQRQYDIVLREVAEERLGADKALEAQQALTAAATEYASKIDYARRTLFDVIKEETIALGGQRTGLVKSSIAEGVWKGPSWSEGNIVGTTEGRNVGIQWQETMERMLGSIEGQGNIFDSLRMTTEQGLSHIMDMGGSVTDLNSNVTGEDGIPGVIGKLDEGSPLLNILGDIKNSIDGQKDIEGSVLGKDKGTELQKPATSPTVSVDYSAFSKDDASLFRRRSKLIHKTRSTDEDLELERINSQLRRSGASMGDESKASANRWGRALSFTHGMTKTMGTSILPQIFGSDVLNMELQDAANQHRTAHNVGKGTGTGIILVGGALGSGVGGVVNAPGTLLTPFATGGIVEKPTMSLIGEKGVEAVVPLPDGKRIPVLLSESSKTAKESIKFPDTITIVLDDTSNLRLTGYIKKTVRGEFV